ncbi:hypothetical protein EMCRGX_G000982 [Ephydatia muelleri]
MLFLLVMLIPVLLLIGAKAEAGSGLGHELRNTRPADILASNWLCGKPAAFDLTVVSPLNPTFISEAGRTAGSAAVAAELRKHSANDAKCSELGWTCIPLVAESYGAWGSEAVQAFSQLASSLATRTNSPKSKVVCSLYGHLLCEPMPEPSSYDVDVPFRRGIVPHCNFHS